MGSYTESLTAGSDHGLGQARDVVLIVGWVQAVPVDRGRYSEGVVQRNVEGLIHGDGEALLSVRLVESHDARSFAVDLKRAHRRLDPYRRRCGIIDAQAGSDGRRSRRAPPTQAAPELTKRTP